MNNFLLRVKARLWDLIQDEEGQDLVEYALVVALIAFGAISGMRAFSSGINHAFTGISSTLTSNT